MGLNLDYIDFDPNEPDSPSRIGSYNIGQQGRVVTSTTVDGREALDVYIASDATNYFEDQPSTSGDRGSLILGVRQDVLGPISTDTNGDYTTLKLTAKGELYTHDSDLLNELMEFNDKFSSVNDGAPDTGASIKFGGKAYSTLGILDPVAEGSRVDFATDLYRRALVNDSMNIAWATSATAVGTTAIRIDPTPLAGRRKVIIQNRSVTPVFVGPSTVTVGNGLEIPARGSLEDFLGEGIALYAISSLAGRDVRLSEAG